MKNSNEIIQIEKIVIVRHVRLFALSKSLGIKSDVLVNVLKQAGHIINSGSKNIILNESQLDIIARAYVNGLKFQFEKTKAELSTFTNTEKTQISNFYSRFLSSELQIKIWSDINFNVFEHKIDEKQAFDYFYYIVDLTNLKIVPCIYNFRNISSKIFTERIACLEKTVNVDNSLKMFINFFFNKTVEEEERSFTKM